MSEVARVRYLDSAERWTMLAMSYVEAPKLAPEAIEQTNFTFSFQSRYPAAALPAK